MNSQRHATLVAAASIAITLTPMLGLFSGLGWTIPLLATIAVISGSAGLVRAGGRGQGLQTLAMAGALLVLLTVGFGGGTGFLFVVPTPATFEHFANLAAAGISDIIVLAPPVEAEGGILFLTMFGVGLVTILHDMFIVGLRTPALAGLTLLTMYLVPVSVSPEATSWFWFILPAAAYLWILADDNLRRVSRFGHRFTGQGHLVGPRFPSPLAASARVSGALFVAVTLALLTIIPTNTSGLLDQVAQGYGEGDGLGDGSFGAVDPWAQLGGALNRPDTIEVARVTTDDPTPFYMRMHVADDLVPDRGFGPGDWDDVQPLDTLPYDGGDVYSATVENLELIDEVAPVYGDPVSVDLGDEWGVESETGVIRSEDSSMADVDEFSFEFTDFQFDENILAGTDPLPEDDPIRQYYTDHPGDIPELDDYVEEATAGADSDFDKVRGVLDFLSTENGFTYDEEVGNSGNDEAILNFLESGEGFCQQYASAMAWMLRVADVPTRVVIGLSKGSYDGEQWTLTSNNFHAWVEVYFDGQGWVPFDPTPGTGVSGSLNIPWDDEPDESIEEPDEGTESPTDESSASDEASGAPSEELPESPTPDSDAGAIGQSDDSGGFNPAWLSLALLAVLPLIPLLWRSALRWTRLRPKRLSAVSAWDETVDLARDYGMPVGDAQTPRQAAASLAQAVPASRAPVSALASAVELHRYSGRGALIDGLPDAVKDLRIALDKSVDQRTRFQAIFRPASLADRFSAWRERVSGRRDRKRPTLRWPRRSNAGRPGPVTGRP
ncbi:transglutaminase TgpA family protein [Glycomyces salinus]|uniref:transglutaminase TgpA family protein n=1 Tax=Glycomyces salinus TaxID=980294 RepID=UPI0018EE3551|nr:DUF3488 and transglutaminase-like domain-containing protein [Glycomyces salinus]